MYVITEQQRIGYDLAKKVPDMRRGFQIVTGYGDIYVDAEDAATFAELAKSLLEEELAALQGADADGR
ncbi:NADP-dependent isocitrate dehydrogenase [Ralstonia pseudosolanacearum]|uniref:NADP-dependent isocitrate dehydrogenase n=1 Tax=Ralstonia solanacearum TaxID=305 RepID=A0AA92K1W6_RALSL|nr:hypothetical protein [Ralstonia pseudosolanacearum]QOK96788.1 NADP-dependent isocitrate dehydrogenase [Ralstonia pseudosolanacearum]